MKIINTLVAAILLNSALPSFGDTRPADLPQNGTIPLDRTLDKDQLEFIVQYPGMGSQVRNGQIVNRWDVPDCVILHSRGVSRTGGIQEQFAALAESIEIADGPGLLFPARKRVIKNLKPELVNGTHIWRISQLGTYLTGLRIKSRDANQTLGEAVTESFTDPEDQVQLTYDRGCRLIPNR